MHRRATALVLAGLACLSLTGCSNEPKSISDLERLIEDTGYQCDEPQREDVIEGHQLICGTDATASYFDDSTAEAEHFENWSELWDSIPSSIDIEEYAIRGDSWHITGKKAALTKVADSLDKEVTSIRLSD